MNTIKFIEKLNNPKIVWVVLPIIVLLETGRTFYPTNLIYFLSRILLLYFLILAYSESKKNKQLKVFLVLVLLFALWILATALWSYDSMVTFPRAFYFAYVAITAAIAGYLWHSYFSKSFLGFLLLANIAIIFLSLFSLITDLPANAWTGGCGIGFMGFAPHQNTLGMMILLTIPSVLFPVFSVIKSKLVRTEKSDSSSFHGSRFTFHFSRLFTLSSIFYLLILLLNLSILILTHSRGSIIAVLLMTSTYFLFSFNWKLVITAGLTLILFIAALFWGSPHIRIAVSDYVFKTEKYIGERRNPQLDATLSAAKHGGLIGLGYGISDPKNILGNVEEGKRYYREKMISVLALVEEVGIIGLILFLSIIGYVFWLLLKSFKTVALSMSKGIQHSTGKWQAASMLAVLIGLSLNAQIEGWWPGAGSWQFLLFFIIIGYSIGLSTSISAD